MLIAQPIRLLVIFFIPIIWICGLATRVIAGTNRDVEVSPEEIVVMACLGKKSGSIETNELEVIKSILSVRSKAVREIMTPRSVLFAVDGNATIDETSKADRLYVHSRVPVFVGDPSDIVGVVYRRDILAALTSGNETKSLRKYMKPVNFVLDSMRLDALLEQFLKRRQHLFVVLNEFDDMCGVVTLEDVLEEILDSEIVDEFDEAVDMQELARRRRTEVIDPLKAAHGKTP